jgi:tetratricopeptide (TPR) repeat protein
MRRYGFVITLLLSSLLRAATSPQQAKSGPVGDPEAAQQTSISPAPGAAVAPRTYQPPSPAATALELEKQGDEYRAQKAFADSIEYYRAALARPTDNPAKAMLYNKMGIAELQMQEFQKAQKFFDRALKKQKDFAQARNNLGAAFYLRKKYSQAIREYKEAIHLNELEASFHGNLGTAYFMTKDFSQAAAEYQRALQLDPDIFDRHSNIGVSAQLSSPENRAKFAYLLAKMYAISGDLDRSLQYLKKAMEDGYKEINDVYKDREFIGLRHDPRFTALMNDKPAAIPE